ncbi:Zinc finger protein 316 [Plakobranchus ocellatus]|uniref:Zinc finger protein 316 n=1 Tax=Plakobranchus ocellatus TaxID=259542 RepID=A0AAV3Y0E8_9GAST|nr:Zinc finger protein 316 [Plakobranchus ocellatus]
MATKDDDSADQLFASEPMTLDPSTFELLAQVPEDEDAAAVVDLPPSLQEAVAGDTDTAIDENEENCDEYNEDETAANLKDSTMQSPQPLPSNSVSREETDVVEVNMSQPRFDRYTSSNRPFPCHVCGKRFTQKAHLIIHKRTHTGEKPYACHICHKRFAQSSHLTVHKRVHTGEKPFFCNFCGMGFCRRPRLEAHVLQHVVREGRQMPANMRGDMFSSLSMVSFHGSSNSRGSYSGRRGARSRGRGRGRGWATGRGRSRLNTGETSELLSATSPPYTRAKDGLLSDVKSEPMDGEEDNDDQIEISNAEGSDEFGDNAIDQLNGENGPTGRRLSGPVTRKWTAGRTAPSTTATQHNNNNQNMSLDDLGRFIGSGSHSNGGIAAQNGNHHLRGGGGVGDSGLTMTGLVRTNSRVSLVDFTAPDIMQHLMSRDDVKSCDYCCIVFNDPAMYYLHRCMHDKMDVRRCNMCGKMAADKYDFMAHFLSQHK